MAYAALLSLSQTLDNILLSRDESLVLDEELQMKSLHQKLISFLEETSQEHSGLIEDLEERIRDVAYEAEEIIESHMSKSKQILSKFESRGVIRFLLDFARCSIPMRPNYEKDLEMKSYEEGLKNVMEKLDSIWGEVVEMKNENKIEGLQIRDPLFGRATVVTESTSEIEVVKMADKNNIGGLQIENAVTGLATHVEVESTSRIGVDEIEEVEKTTLRNLHSLKFTSTKTSVPIVGFEAQMLSVKELLLAGSSTKLEVISIVGMGGIGKTTLTRSIYNDSFVNGHFDIKAWATVSQKYDVVALLEALLISTGKLTEEMNGMDMEQLKHTLYQSLKQRRYVIVMDDVWDTDFLKEFKNIFPDDNNASRIIMTSRSSEVSTFENYSSHIYRMNFLSLEQSWNLLRQKALGEEPCRPGLDEIGWKIAEKCKGLPLALVVVGGVLYNGKKTRAYWTYIEENMKSAEVGNYDGLMEVMSLSYNHLPHHLKTCFLYMAVYPEDYIIHVSHLIRLWLAEGFIKPTPRKTLEHVAKEYLEDLIARNLIMVRERNYYGEIKTCTVHDLIRDLCMTKAREKIFLYVADKYELQTINVQRYISIHGKGYSFPFDQTIRSLLYFRHAYDEWSTYIPFDLNLLRVLDACSIRLRDFPDAIQNLVNLRYLALFYAGESGFASPISKLFNLQTLIVVRKKWRHEGGIIYLSPEILKMPSLRNLLVDGSSFSSYPCGAPNGNLQVLSSVVNFRFTKGAIQNCLDLKTLGIVYRYNRKTKWSFYCLENLVRLQQLENLKLHFDGGDNWCQLPLNLSFPQKLNKLTLSDCIISLTHTSAIGSIPNLQVLKLKNVAFENCVWKTNAEQFSKLKFLHVGSFELEHWEAEESNFPVLECLRLRYCHNLECIPSGIGQIQCLRNIVLDECSSEVVNSANDILNEQHEFGNESLQLHVFPDKNGRLRSSICFHKNYYDRIGEKLETKPSRKIDGMDQASEHMDSYNRNKGFRVSYFN